MNSPTREIFEEKSVEDLSMNVSRDQKRKMPDRDRV